MTKEGYSNKKKAKNGAERASPKKSGFNKPILLLHRRGTKEWVIRRSLDTGGVEGSSNGHHHH